LESIQNNFIYRTRHQTREKPNSPSEEWDWPTRSTTAATTTATTTATTITTTTAKILLIKFQSKSEKDRIISLALKSFQR